MYVSLKGTILAADHEVEPGPAHNKAEYGADPYLKNLFKRTNLELLQILS